MKKRILIVDDEVGIRLLMEDLLESDGHTIYTAENGKEALELLQKQTVDLLIIDYKLPVIDGVEVIKQLHNEEKDIDVIVMSGLVENIKDELKNMPRIKSILSKPFNVMEVKEYINQL